MRRAILKAHNYWAQKLQATTSSKTAITEHVLWRHNEALYVKPFPAANSGQRCLTYQCLYALPALLYTGIL